MHAWNRRFLLSVLTLSLSLAAPLHLRAGDKDRPAERRRPWREELNIKPEDKVAAQQLYLKLEALMSERKPGTDDAAAAEAKKLVKDFIKEEPFPSAKVGALREFIFHKHLDASAAAPPTPRTEAAGEIRRTLFEVFHELSEESLLQAERSPNDPAAQSRAAGHAFQNRSWRDSARAARNALRMDPDDSRMHYTMARDLYELGDYKESSKSATEAIKRDPKNAAAWSARAAAAFKLEDWKNAYADARQAAALDPQDHMASTIAQVSKQRIDGFKIPDIRPLLDEDKLAAARGLGNAKVPGGSDAPDAGTVRGQPGESSGHLSAELERTAGGPPPGYRAQSFYKESLNKLELGDYQAAAESAAHSIALSPGSPEPYAARASAYNYLGRYPEAVKDATRSLELERSNHVALNARSWALNHDGHPREALADAQAAAQLAPRDAFAYLNKAMAEEALGMWDEMEQDYVAAATLEPDFRPNLEAAAQRFETATGRAFKGLAAMERPRGSFAAKTRRWTFSAAALVAGLGGGFLLAFLVATSLKSEDKTGQAKTASAAPGAVIGGCYQVGRELGRGGMGVVYEADDLALGRKVALKRMKDDLKDRPSDKEHFMEEARTVAALKHPNIVAIHSIFEEEGDLFLVFEFVPGMTLDEHLYRRKKLSPAEARDVLKPVCDALAYAHGRKVIHRDLKPTNIMIGEDGVIKVMDFGLARQAKETLAAMSRTDAAGTPAYMAPEMERGLVRKESDIYMLGGVLYEMLTGTLPSKKGSTDLPSEISAVISKAMAREPEKRFSTPQEFLEAYDLALRLITQA